MSKKKKTLFWAAEIILLAAAAFFAFAMVGYSTMALMLLAAAATVAVYRLIGVYGVRRPERAKCLRFALTVLLIIGLIGFTALEIPVVADARTDPEPKADYLVVLGAGVNGTVPSLSLLDRLEAALEYLERYPEAKAIVSGGQGPGEDITEALCMALWLEGRGIDPGRIIQEDRASSTQENLEFSQELIRKDGGDPRGRVAIVSSEYHLHRAKLMAAELGMEPLGVAAKTRLPVLRINYFIREAFALGAYLVF